MPEKVSSGKKTIFSQDIAHYLIGFSILAKGWAKLEHHNHQLAEIIFIFIAGSFIILGTALHHKLEKRIKNFTATFHIAEGVALLMVGWILFQEGSRRIHYFYIFLGGIFCIIGLTILLSRKESREKLQFLLMQWIGIAFVAAGLLTFILNRIGDKDIWITAIAAVLVLAGSGMTIRSQLKMKSRIFSKKNSNFTHRK